MANLIEIVESPFFLWGLAMGGLAWILGRWAQSVTKAIDPLPIGGLLISVASLVAVAGAGAVPVALWLGLGLILLLTFLVESLKGSTVIVALASLPGAIVVSLAGSSEPVWVRTVVVISIPVVGFLMNDFESRYERSGLGMIFFGLAAAGSFLAVPDTEWIRTLFAVAIPLSFLAWPRARVSLGTTGGYMAAAVFVLFTSEGGIGRPASVIGALACLGLLVIEPVAVRLRPQMASLADRLPFTSVEVLLAAVPQLVIVLAASRIAARTSSFARGLFVVTVVFALAWAALFWASEQDAAVTGRTRLE